MIVIDRHDSTPFYRQIHRQVVEGIQAGIYRADDRLPSIRTFAQNLGVSRNTVEQAYLMLTEEGFVRARQGSGYYINAAQMAPIANRTSHPAVEDARRELSEFETARAQEREMRFDFSPDATDSEMFPYYRWAKISREVMLDHGRGGICEPLDPRGLPALREQIARYLGKERGIVADAGQIAVFPSTRYAVASAIALLDHAATRIMVDRRNHPVIMAGIIDAKPDATPQAVDFPFASEPPEARPEPHGKQVLFCAPPDSRVEPDDRKQLVEWAHRSNAILFEDARGHEFRSIGSQLPPLHALDDDGSVITLASFANSLAPSLDIAYLVLPPKLMIAWLNKGRGGGDAVNWQTQSTLAEFMAQGLWYSHLRRLQTHFRRKHDTLVAAIDRSLGDSVEMMAYGQGAHVLLASKDRRTASELIALAATHDVRVYPANGNQVLIGYSGIPLADIDSGIRELARAWR
ncbi:MAG: PLP-dependent aminotransferase family protein [Coriobacteriia bacterium]|nr:PLP-dependent aminotransferase family protein [Coriobacteriia bacterium]